MSERQRHLSEDELRLYSGDTSSIVDRMAGEIRHHRTMQAASRERVRGVVREACHRWAAALIDEPTADAIADRAADRLAAEVQPDREQVRGVVREVCHQWTADLTDDPTRADQSIDEATADIIADRVADRMAREIRHHQSARAADEERVRSVVIRAIDELSEGLGVVVRNRIADRAANQLAAEVRPNFVAELVRAIDDCPRVLADGTCLTDRDADVAAWLHRLESIADQIRRGAT